MDVIYPATDKHILKYTNQPMYLVLETEEMYQTITLPYILDNSFSLQVSMSFFKWLKRLIFLKKTKIINLIEILCICWFSGFTIA